MSSEPQDPLINLAAAHRLVKDKRVYIVAVCAAAVLILYFAWKSNAFSFARNAAPAENKAPQAAPLNYKALIQDENFHVFQGMAYGDAGLFDQAIFEEMEAFRLNPRNFAALNNVGFYLFKAGRYADSAAALERALRLQPASDLARNNLRNTYNSALEAASTPAQKETIRQRKEKLEAGTLVDFLNQAEAEASQKK